MNFKDIKHPKQKGEATEAIILADLLKNGALCCKPIGDNLPFDLIIYNKSNKRFFTVQCRTASFQTTNSFQFKTVNSRNNAKKTIQTDLKEFIDLFAVYCPEIDTVCYVWCQHLPDYVSLRVAPTKNNQDNLCNFVKDYTLDKIIEAFL